MSEQRKRMQIRNSVEERSLQEKIRCYNREQNYVDKELRQIILAKQSLVRSLRAINLDLDSSSKAAKIKSTQKATWKKEQTKSVAKESAGDQFRPAVNKCFSTVNNSRKISIRPPNKSSFIKDSELLTASVPGHTRHVVLVPALPANNKTNSAKMGLPDDSISTTTTTDNNDQAIAASEEPRLPVEIKPCLPRREGTINHPRRNSKVRFSFPLTTSQNSCETEEVRKISDGRKTPAAPAAQGSRFEGNSETLDKIKIRSRLYQIGSLALATAIFKSASRNASSCETRPKSPSSANQIGDSDCLKEKKNDSEQMNMRERETTVIGHKKIMRSKSGCFAVPVRREKILVKRISQSSCMVSDDTFHAM